MLTAFWLNNLSFAIELATAITFFLLAFLQFDSWTIKKDAKTGLQGLGYFILGISFVLLASHIDQQKFFTDLLISGSFVKSLVTSVKIVGLFILISGLLLDKQIPTPNLKGVALVGVVGVISPLAFIIVTVLKFLKATKGFEKHQIWVAIGFLFITLGDIVYSLSFLKDSSFLVLRDFYSVQGSGFILQNIFGLIGVIVLFTWAFGYLRFRLLSQLFLYFTLGSLVIFLITTFVFVSFLLNNLSNSAKSNLLISGKSFQYSLSQLEDKALLTARAQATSPSLQANVVAANRSAIYNQITSFFFPTKGDYLMVTNADGVVLVNSEDRDDYGKSVSGKEVVGRARGGFEGTATLVDKREGIDQLLVEASSPVKVNNKVVGTVVAGYSIDNFFVDSVKAVTGLDVTVYAGKVKAATTFLSPDKKDRLTGSVEASTTIIDKVLNHGEQLATQKRVFGKDYTAVYLPIKNTNGKASGMVFVGRPASEILDTANKSINLTFLVTAFLTLLSIVPAFWLAKFISAQQQA